VVCLSAPVLETIERGAPEGFVVLPMTGLTIGGATLDSLYFQGLSKDLSKGPRSVAVRIGLVQPPRNLAAEASYADILAEDEP
jgi:hypothetical protein